MSDSQIKISDVVVQSGAAAFAEIDGETVALDVNTGLCYGLNAVGSRIWTLVASPTPVSKICDVLVDEYEVERSVCEEQVLELLEGLRGEGLLVKDNG